MPHPTGKHWADLFCKLCPLRQKLRPYPRSLLRGIRSVVRQRGLVYYSSETSVSVFKRSHGEHFLSCFLHIFEVVLALINLEQGGEFRNFPLLSHIRVLLYI